jgi:hypothetical protein
MRRWIVVSAVLAVLVGVATIVVMLWAGTGRGSTPTVAVPRYDPPHQFDRRLAVNLPREADGDPPPIALETFTAYVALPVVLQVIDTRTVAVRAKVPPTAKASQVTPRAPVLGRLAGRDVVVAAFAVVIPGHGTTVGHDAVELVILGRDTLDRLAGARVDLPASLGDTTRLRTVRVLGMTGEVATVVVQTGAEQEPTTYSVDLRSGAVRWRVPGFAAAYAENDLVIGVRREPTGSRAAALRAGDGLPVWTMGSTGESVTVARGGPALLAVVSVTTGNGGRALTFYDTRTGRAQARRVVPGGVTCRFDEQLTTVCWNADAGEPWAAGFDASTARPRWELPNATAGRVAPRITTVWHGAVYGTTENGAVVLQTSDGRDWTGSAPKVAPSLVNDVVGIVGASIDRPRPRAYRAVG